MGFLMKSGALRWQEPVSWTLPPRNFLSMLNKKANIYPLGGINVQNIYRLKLLNVKGFGGISIFKKKPAQQGAGFQRIKFL